MSAIMVKVRHGLCIGDHRPVADARLHAIHATVIGIRHILAAVRPSVRPSVRCAPVDLYRQRSRPSDRRWAGQDRLCPVGRSNRISTYGDDGAVSLHKCRRGRWPATVYWLCHKPLLLLLLVVVVVLWRQRTSHDKRSDVTWLMNEWRQTSERCLSRQTMTAFQWCGHDAVQITYNIALPLLDQRKRIARHC